MRFNWLIDCDWIKHVLLTGFFWLTCGDFNESLSGSLTEALWLMFKWVYSFLGLCLWAERTRRMNCSVTKSCLLIRNCVRNWKRLHTRNTLMFRCCCSARHAHCDPTSPSTQHFHGSNQHIIKNKTDKTLQSKRSSQRYSHVDPDLGKKLRVWCSGHFKGAVCHYENGWPFYPLALLLLVPPSLCTRVFSLSEWPLAAITSASLLESVSVDFAHLDPHCSLLLLALLAATR